MNISKIDRKALVRRHNPRYTRPELEAPLSVGNGDFCYTVDFTGLQTFTSIYNRFPLCTMSGWGWHSYPAGLLAASAPEESSAGESAIHDFLTQRLRLTPFDTWGRETGYAVDSSGQEELFDYLRQNPHRFNLGSLGLDIPGAALNDFDGINQSLDLWEGIIESAFAVKGEKAVVETFVHPDEDTICVRVESGLFIDEKLRLRLDFPYGSHKKPGGDNSKPERHESRPVPDGASLLNIKRGMDRTNYTVQVLMGEGASWHFDGAHGFVFGSSRGCLTLVFRFVRDNGSLISGIQAAEFYGEAKARTAAFWENYWNSGGAVDLGDSQAPGAAELERRVTLSQYLTAIQSRGVLPPAETGLTCNSWYGKFHLEMHYWHSAHFALWNRTGELEKSLSWYKKILGEARKIASSQGYSGARWPKMCGPSGDNSPSSIAVLLVWQQPHPIMYAELCYRQNRSRAFLEEYRDVVLESAEFMLSFIHWDGARYVLGPPLIPAQERFDPRTVLNPGYEVEYFRWAFRAANVWLRRLGENQRRDFEEAARKLSPPVVYEGVFQAHENCQDTFTRDPFNTDHPSMLGMTGLLPGEGIDREIMNATLDHVLKDWDIESCWGWDFPMMAMTAARLGRKSDAVNFLLMDSPKNTYLANGHNAQGDKDDLPLYLPGNGGLLLAVAMMAAGWDGDDGSFAPGFPVEKTARNGSYRVKAENLSKYI